MSLQQAWRQHRGQRVKLGLELEHGRVRRRQPFAHRALLAQRGGQTRVRVVALRSGGETEEERVRGTGALTCFAWRADGVQKRRAREQSGASENLPHFLFEKHADSGP